MNPRDIPPEAFRSSGAELQAIDFGYVRSPDQDCATPAQHPVVVVGAGPVGLSLAIDLAQRGQPVVVLDNDHKLSIGSRAICFAKRTLEIWDRLGVGQRMVDKGVSWNLGKVFLKDEQLYEFNLLPEEGHERPAFISDLYESVKASAAQGEDLRKVYEATFAKLQPKYGHWVIFNHCMPFDVTRAYDEATQYPDPRIWTAERDVQMWKALEG